MPASLPSAARRLGFVAAASIVVANMIGTAVFTSTGFQAASLHDPWTILIAWAVGGVLALCGASAYAELGAMMPEAGGEYVYLREAYHPMVGFLSGWTSLFAGFSAPIAVAAIAFGKYATAVFPALGHWSLAVGDHAVGAPALLGVGLVLAMTGLHAFDTVIGGRVQAAFSIAKASLITVFVIAGLMFGHGDTAHFAVIGGGPAAHAFTRDFAVALMFVTFAYSGWNAAAYIAGDLRDPGRTVPRALLVGTGLVTLLYLLLNVTFLYALSPATLADGPVIEVGDTAARALLGATAGRLFSSLIALGLISAVSAMVMAGPRVYAAMAGDGALPGVFGVRSARGVPWVSVVLQGAIASVIVLYGDLGKVIQYVGFLLSIFAALAVAAVPILRRTRAHATRPYRDVGYPVTTVLFVGAAVWVTYAQVDAGLGHVWWGLGSLAVGAIIWVVPRVLRR